MFVRADDHFLGAATGGDQADAGLDQAQVGFGRGLNARTVQANFAAAAQRHSLRSDDDRLRRMLEREIRVLKAADGIVDVVPFLLPRGHQEEH